MALKEWPEFLRSKLCLGPIPTNHRRLSLEKRKKMSRWYSSPRGRLLLILLVFQAHQWTWGPGNTNRPSVEWRVFLEKQERGKIYTPFSAFIENV